MLTSSEQICLISLPREDLKDPLESFPVGSPSDHSFELVPCSKLSNSQPLPAVCTDMTVSPEHEKDELKHAIANLEEEILLLRQKQRLLDQTRKVALNSIIDIKGSIRVFCRVLPFLPNNRRKFDHHVMTELEKVVIKIPGGTKEFGFDRVFPVGASQEDVFCEVKPIIRSALDGHNVCVLAYGQTGTGKTFTMDGMNDHPGIVPRALEELFTQSYLNELSSQSFSMSMLEVYMGNIRDLLAPKTMHKPHETSTRCNLNIQTDTKGLVEIDGLTEVQISDLGKAKWWYNRGKRARATSWTHVNEASSRSHCLTRIAISQTRDSKDKAEMSKLWMVDLGGSERVLKTGATGQTLDEGRAINLSLSALGDVIASLRRKRGHVPYRNSKLTQILKDSLGLGSKVLMLVHISPSEDDVAETICSLSFAKRARAVESTRDIPEDLKKQHQKRLAELEAEMRKVEEKCSEVQEQILKAEFLLNENKKLFEASYGPSDDEDKKISTPKGIKQVSKIQLISDKPTKPYVPGLVPRFMTSTVASRQRQSASERDIVGRMKSTRLVTRGSVQLSVSQSFIYSEPLVRAVVSDQSSKKSRYVEPKAFPLTECPKSNKGSDLKPHPRSKMVTSSDPNLRVALSRHRRRVSSMI
ncbi:hypothetical protein SAY87_010550 [Trapa incisa]|uniref:Kinesin motor domain-containing protein n=1 Tax=Trapa incisa TaxID=236973 RepID=A0AAN7GHA1_9MYRT|nr:hypothetical protein SAY87_010550 [Trapa incisa]